MSVSNVNCIPINALSPYITPHWAIKVRVTSKGLMREFKGKNTGKVFSFDVIDEQGTEIRVTCFNKEADRFFSVVFPKKVYFIKRGRIKTNNGFSRIRHDYAITCTANSEITEFTGDVSNFAKRKFNFVSIGELPTVPEASFCDVAAVVDSIAEMNLFQSKGRQLKKRVITIKDDTNYAVHCTLWANMAEEFDQTKLPRGSVVVMPGCKVSSFGGRSLSCNMLMMGEDIDYLERAKNLEHWWVNGGCNDEVKQMSVESKPMVAERLTWAEFENSKKGYNHEGKPNWRGDYFNLKGTVTLYYNGQNGNQERRRNPWYNSAPDPNVQAKVIQKSDGTWFCEKNNTTYDSYIPQYILSFAVADAVGSRFARTFNNIAENLLGFSAAEAERTLKSNEMEYNNMFRKQVFQDKMFTFRARSEVYENVPRMRIDCVRASPIDFVEECEYLLKILS